MTFSSLTMGASLAVKTSVAGNGRLAAAFEHHRPSLFRYMAARVGGDAHLAEDLLQQLWVQIDGRGEHVPDSEVGFWFRGIAANLVRSHWRTQARRPAHVPIADSAVAAGLAQRLTTEEMPAEALAAKETRDQLLLAVTALDRGDQELIVGCYFRGLSHAQLAAACNVSERAVEGRLYRARRALRDTLMSLDS